MCPNNRVDSNNIASTDHTTWDYNADGTVQKVTDARGSVSNFTYNGRHLVTGVSYTLFQGFRPLAPPLWSRGGRKVSFTTALVIVLQ